jgi:hypothetical protein
MHGPSYPDVCVGEHVLAGGESFPSTRADTTRYADPEVALNTGMILKEMLRYEPLAKILLYSDQWVMTCRPQANVQVLHVPHIHRGRNVWHLV